ncbi:hypothetical protein [Nostoc sp. MG11]|uniref:hypothetical protein n=1 Tax=Nostoc sp. MG11 TaxID=2721166 RepID=UPI001866E009|nr:hypothetical protein [Nostoc sp. MG11]
MLSQRLQRFFIITLVFLLFLTIASGIFAYQVSPLRDPNFQPNSANGGSLIPWMKGVTEGHWSSGANVLAFLVSTNLTLISWQQGIFSQGYNKWLRFILITITSIMFFVFFWIIFMLHLLSQWLVD